MAELQVSDKDDYKKRLEVLEEQQELIQDEKEQEEKEASARMAAKAKEQEEKEAALAQEEAAKARAAEPEQVAEVISDQVGLLIRERSLGSLTHAHVQARPEDHAEVEDKSSKEDSSSVRLTKEQLNELGSALEILSEKSSFLQERSDLRTLYEDNLKTEAAAKEAGELVDDNTVALGKRVRGMIKKIDQQLEECELRALLFNPYSR